MTDELRRKGSIFMAFIQIINSRLFLCAIHSNLSNVLVLLLSFSFHSVFPFALQLSVELFDSLVFVSTTLLKFGS